MARMGVDYRVVEDAVQKILSDGGKPTIRNIRRVIGTGSPNTILKHVHEWKCKQPGPPSAKLPDLLTRMIQQELAKVAATAEKRLAEAMEDLDALADEAQELEVEKGRLEARISEVSTERDKAVAVAQERAQMLQRLREELSLAQESLTSSRVELSVAQMKIENLNGRLAEMKTEASDLREELVKVQAESHGRALEIARLVGEKNGGASS